MPEVPKTHKFPFFLKNFSFFCLSLVLICKISLKYPLKKSQGKAVFKTLGFCLFVSCLCADTAPQTPPITAWFTGPLLCPSYSAVPAGSYNIEPYIFVNTIGGNYDSSWTRVSTQTLISAYYSILAQIGLTSYFNVSITPQFFYQSLGPSSSANIGDLPVEAYFIVLNEDLNGIRPGITIGLKASVPLGRYKNLSPGDASTQAVGSGSWKPAMSFVIGKQIHIKDIHFLTLRAYFNSQFQNRFNVDGFHAYGGGYETKGQITLGAQFTTIASFEYSFSRHGVFALDIQYQHNNKSSFKGNAGYTDPIFRKLLPPSNAPSSEQLSLAPALEYNFNANVGLIAGVWFTVAGRNAQAFITPTCALNIEY